MSAFSETELAYLVGERRLGRIATVGRDGTPHVVPVGWSYNAEQDTIDVGGRELEQTKKFRDAARSGRAAIVIDDLASTDPWRPRAVASACIVSATAAAKPASRRSALRS
jgi:pyridoxamine 5'-phosphate oxidase family protein